MLFHSQMKMTNVKIIGRQLEKYEKPSRLFSSICFCAKAFLSCPYAFSSFSISGFKRSVIFWFLRIQYF